MLLPLVVLDVHEKVARNPDYVLSLDDVKDWESRHGRIPQHAFVAMFRPGSWQSCPEVNFPARVHRS